MLVPSGANFIPFTRISDGDSMDITIIISLTHWGRDKMDTILQTNF